VSVIEVAITVFVVLLVVAFFLLPGKLFVRGPVRWPMNRNGHRDERHGSRRADPDATFERPSDESMLL
jgi:hypothetical protein